MSEFSSSVLFSLMCLKCSGTTINVVRELEKNQRVRERRFYTSVALGLYRKFNTYVTSKWSLKTVVVFKAKPTGKSLGFD